MPQSQLSALLIATLPRNLPLELITKILHFLIEPTPICTQSGIIRWKGQQYHLKEKTRLEVSLALVQTCKLFYLLVRPHLWCKVSAKDPLPLSVRAYWPNAADFEWPSDGLQQLDPEAYNTAVEVSNAEYYLAGETWLANRRLDLAFRADPVFSTGIRDRVRGDAVCFLDLSQCWGITDKGWERTLKSLRNLHSICFPISTSSGVETSKGWPEFNKLADEHPIVRYFRQNHFQLLGIGWTATQTGLQAACSFLSKVNSLDHLWLRSEVWYGDRIEEEEACTHLLQAIVSWSKPLRSITIDCGFPAVAELVRGLPNAASALEVFIYFTTFEPGHLDDTHRSEMAESFVQLKQLQTFSFIEKFETEHTTGHFDRLFYELPRLKHICLASDTISTDLFTIMPSTSIETVIFCIAEASNGYISYVEGKGTKKRGVKLMNRNVISGFWKMVDNCKQVSWDTTPDYTRILYRSYGQKLYTLFRYYRQGYDHVVCSDARCACVNVTLTDPINYSPPPVNDTQY